MIEFLTVALYLSSIFINNIDYSSFVLERQKNNVVTYEKIFYMSESKEKEGIASLLKNYEKIDIIAPQFYGVSAKLELNGGLSNNLKNIIKEKDLKVMPLVTNYAFRQDIMHNLLISEIGQNRIINSLVKEAKKENYLGWQFDFENISYKDKDLYSAFVEKSAEALHKNGFILSVAAVSRYVDYEDTNAYKNWSGVFDYARISKAVDFISMMTYDDPSSTGPVASLPFVNKVLEYVKDKIPAEKLSLGIPLYYWSWSKNPSKRVISSGTYDGLLYIRNNYEHDKGYSADLGTAWLSYINGDQEYTVWYQEKKSFQERIDLVNINNYRGFSAWVLGVEDPQIWESL